MSQEDAIAHWWRGAHDAMEAAELLFKAGKYSLALFHCHLAAEKGLKAAFITTQNAAPPATHDLVLLAGKAGLTVSDRDWDNLSILTRFVVHARYDDPGWAEREATRERTEEWLRETERFLTFLNDGHA